MPRVALHDSGGIVFVGVHCDDDLELRAPWLNRIYKEARKHDCILINFDRDADPSPLFPLYEW